MSSRNDRRTDHPGVTRRHVVAALGTASVAALTTWPALPADAAVRAAAPAAPPVLREGSRGPDVLAVQQRLAALGYWLGQADGRFGPLTTQAVYAVQKAAGLPRHGRVDDAVRTALRRGVRPVPALTGTGVEVDLSSQLLLVVAAGRLQTVLNTSTGTGKAYTDPHGRQAVATTPTGRFAVSWAVDGWRTSDLGRLYRPRYFHPRGIAVHGATSVPAYPASHGCARVSLAAMDLIWRSGAMPLHGTVLVHA